MIFSNCNMISQIHIPEISSCVQRVFSKMTLLHICSFEGALTRKLANVALIRYNATAASAYLTLFVEVPSHNNQIRPGLFDIDLEFLILCNHSRPKIKFNESSLHFKRLPYLLYNFRTIGIGLLLAFCRPLFMIVA
jgi:hypothetical protein